MGLTKSEWPVLIVNAVYVSVFTLVAVTHLDFEFLLYSGVVLTVVLLILGTQRRIEFDLPILWGLTAWGVLHLTGGNLRVGDGVLYGLELIPLVPRFQILRYDQVVHVFGFGVATLVCYHLLRSYLRSDIPRWWVLGFLVVLMGSGVGALNEIIEFIAVLSVPETGVGGYDNTMLDLVFNLFGGLLALGWITWRNRRTRGSRARRVVDVRS